MKTLFQNGVNEVYLYGLKSDVLSSCICIQSI